MKCIRDKEGRVKRLTDAVAQALVDKGEAVFIDKKTWKSSK
jgi:hypothetical protein